MNHRHLLPEEIDLLLDDEVGFGVNPLRAHVRECAECRARVDEGRAVVGVLEDLPHFAPSHDFADRVMSQVPVFVPWHVSAQQAIVPYIPKARAAQVAVAALATSAASLITLAILWVTTQTDVLVVASGAASDQVRGVFYDAARLILAGVFGDQTFAAIQRMGNVGIGLALVGLLAAAGGSIAGLRALATVSSRRRA